MTQKTERSNYDQQAPFKEIWHESPGARKRDGLGVGWAYLGMLLQRDEPRGASSIAHLPRLAGVGNMALGF